MNRSNILGLLIASILLALSASSLALAAAPLDAEPVRYALLTMTDPGSRVLLYFEVRNVGTTTWAPGSVTLRNVANPMGAAGQFGLTRAVLPNETVYWDFEVKAPNLPGVHESTWQIMRGGAAISSPLACYVIAVPKEAQELRTKIQALIDQFNQEHGHEVKQVVRMITDLIQREGKGLIQKLIESRCGLLSGMLAVLAFTLGARRGGTP